MAPAARGLVIRITLRSARVTAASCSRALARPEVLSARLVATTDPIFGGIVPGRLEGAAFCVVTVRIP
ncbi:MAG: hypothetical protein J2P28_16535, partial [Actinobacteria bacterium]|nr:hypothetical protein [Actinomycetota bacterium]